MKNKLMLFAAGLLVSGLATAQVDRSTYPDPAPAREIQLGNAESFTLPNGLQVFVVENNKLPRVTFSLVLDRDPLLEKEKSGMVGMVGEMMMGGTKNRTKDQLDEEIDFIGASISAGSTSIFASSLKKHQDKALELLTDVLYNPIFPEEELEKLKKQAITGLAAAKDDPNAISGRLTSRLVYGDAHPYGEIQTEATLKNIEVADIKNYYTTYFRPNIAYMAVVGDITAAEAKAIVEKYFGKWEKGDVPTYSYDKPQAPAETMVALVDRPSSVQAVVNITYPVEMNIDHPDYLSTRVLNYILGGGSSSRLFMNLREDKGYTYGAYSSLGSDRLIARFSASASVKQVAADSAVNEMIYEIRNLRDKGVTAEELEAAKANLAGSFGRSLESPSTIANFAINMKRYNLPADFYSAYLQRLEALTVEDLNAAAKKYMKPDNMYVTVVGNTAEFGDRMGAFGNVAMFTNMGEPEKEMVAAGDMTAEAIIANYLSAIGGADKAASIRSAKVTQEAEIQGTKLNIESIHDEDNSFFVQRTKMMGNTMATLILEGASGKMVQMGQEQALSDEQVEAMKPMSFIIPELHYELLGYTMRVEGIKEVEGEEAYKVDVMTPTGSKQTTYYSVASGLKVKMESAENGDMVYRDYKEVDGVKYPMTIIANNPMIPVPLEMKIQSIAFNVEIADADKN
ncbi:MAG: insulinase family protein [Nitritalea sp.]